MIFPFLSGKFHVSLVQEGSTVRGKTHFNTWGVHPASSNDGNLMILLGASGWKRHVVQMDGSIANQLVPNAQKVELERLW